VADVANDALDPGPQNMYPYFPRTSTGAPFWSDSELTDGSRVDPQGVVRPYAPMPRGKRKTKDSNGRWVEVDVTPRGPGGVAINPPNLP